MKYIARTLLATAILSMAQVGVLQADPVEEKKKYVASVVTLLRIHAQAIEQMTTHRFKYSDNLARHATAIKNAIGLLGPMEWHIAKSEMLYRRTDNEMIMDAALFDQLADSSTKSIKKLHVAAIKEVEEGKTGSTMEALDTMQRTCEQCHALLPKGATPDVWNPKVPPGD